MSRSARAGLTLFLVILGSAGPARADWLLVPFAGATFAGQSSAIVQLDSEAVSRKHWLVGGSAAWLTDGILGLEIDVALVPGIFEGENPDNLIAGSQATTLSGNVLLAVPLSITRDSLRPYLAGGLGLARYHQRDRGGIIDGDFSDAALQLGGGAIGLLSDRTGVRFDLRQVRTLRRGDTLLGERQPKLSFWRATLGVVIRY